MMINFEGILKIHIYENLKKSKFKKLNKQISMR